MSWRRAMALAVLAALSVAPVAARHQDEPPAADSMEPDAASIDTPTPTPAATATPAVLTSTAIANRIRPSVVQIITPDGGKATGVQIAAGLLTNGHVVANLTTVEVITSEGTHASATVLRTDTSRDLALLSTDVPLPAVDLEPLASQQQGDEVFVLGYPLGLDGPASLTRGLISAIRLNDHGLDLVQTDAASTGGSSGSPVINARGEVLGIHSYGVPGVGFAIATESINSFLANAPSLDSSPLPWLAAARLTPTATPVPIPAARPFAGTADDAAIRAEDLGTGWAILERRYDDIAPPQTLGILRITFKHSSGVQLRTATVVFLTRAAAVTGWGNPVGGSLEVCDASAYNVTGDSGAVTGACLVQNVLLAMSGGSYDLTRAAFGRAVPRISSRLTVDVPTTAQPPLFRGPPSAIAVQPGEVGSGWVTVESHQDAANQYSSGKLWLTLQQGGSGSTTVMAVSVEVFRDVSTASAAWKHDSEGLVGGPVVACDEGWI